MAVTQVRTRNTGMGYLVVWVLGKGVSAGNMEDADQRVTETKKKNWLNKAEKPDTRKQLLPLLRLHPATDCPHSRHWLRSGGLSALVLRLGAAIWFLV